MKQSKIVIPVILLAILSLSWFTTINGAIKNHSAYSNCISEAELSVQNGLYEQGIELYKESLKYKNAQDVYLKIKETYEKYYDEEKTTFVRNCFIEDMELASEAFPKCADFWVVTANLYIEAINYSSAYKVIQKGLNYGAKSQALDQLYSSMLYMVKVDYKLYSAFKTALNGYITVLDGNKWTVLDGNGEKYSSNYNNIGLINDLGSGFYSNEIDSRFLDKNEITRARFDFDFEDAGYYNEKSKYAPVKINGVWKYVNLSGEFLPGEYDTAGSFYEQQAAVRANDKWSIIDNSGNIAQNTEFEDIKLDLHGSYIQSGIVIAKINGKYRLYNEKFEQIGNFECEDIDICIDGNLIAFCQSGKWGYVDTQGQIIVEPLYSKAKSFSNKMAAVCNEKGQWGFINSKYNVVIDYQYLDAFYFNDNDTAIISTAENTVQVLHFMFE